MKKILLWIRMLRPQTLPASLCPVAIGLLAVPLHAPCVAAITLLCALSLQILSNLINDYYDFVRGADQAGRAGFKRGLAEGEVSVGQLLVAIAIVLLVAVGTGAFLVGQGGWPILLIGLSAHVFRFPISALPTSLCSPTMVWWLLPALLTCRQDISPPPHFSRVACADYCRCAY